MQSSWTYEDLERMTLTELKKISSKCKIKGYTKFNDSNKLELVILILKKCTPSSRNGNTQIGRIMKDITSSKYLLDQSLGCWLNGTYYIDENHRYYAPSTIPSQIEGCSDKIKQLFKTAPVNLDRQYYQKGRNHYPIRGIGIYNRKSISPISMNEKMLGVPVKPLFENYCSMSNLICSLFNVSSWKSLKENGYCGTAKMCTIIGSKIAKSLIKIAATRIFADPEQSILELPVNSMDAYSTTGTVGKFGLGFFSILYWLVEHPERYLLINSYYADSTSPSGFTAFRVKIQESEDELVFDLESYPSNVTVTGTQMILNASNDTFDRKTVENFKKQLNKLKYTDSVLIASKIELNSTSLFFDKFNDSFLHNKKQIILGLSEDGILVEDYASGITLDVLLTKLFIPAISTKKIGMADNVDTQYRNKSRIIPYEGEDNAIFLIRGIGVVDIPMNTNRKTTVIFDLPGTTRLPVSRDDIILDKIGQQNLRLAMQKLVQESLERYANIYYLQQAVKAYQTYTSNQENITIIGSILSNEIRKQYTDKMVFVPHQHFKIYSRLQLMSKPIASETPDTSRLYNILRDYPGLRKDIYMGKNVIILESLDTPVTSAGTISTLFVDKKYTETNEKWIENLAMSYAMTESLYIIKEKEVYDAAEIEMFDKLRGMFSPETAKYVQQLYIAVHALPSRYIVYPSTLMSELLYLIKIMVNNLDDEEFVRIWVSNLTSAYTTLKPNTVYGAGKPDYLSHKGVPFTVTMRKLATEKEKRFAKEWLLRISKFYDTTVFRTWTDPMLILPLIIRDRNLRNYQVLGKHGYNVIVENYEEFNSVYEVILFAYFMGAYSFTLPKNRPLFIKQFLHIVRLQIPDIKDIFNAIHYPDPYIVRKLRTGLSIILDKLNKNIESLPTIRVEVPHVTYTRFKQSELMQYTLRNDYKNLDELFEKASTVESKSSDIQITEIAVNEGSTKNYSDAVLTELIQNSLDAIRTFNPRNTNIDVAIGNDLFDSNKLIVSVTDYVGISDEGILSMMIPFLSSKTPSEIVTGEMGSGFFNIYRNADTVYIETIKDEKVTFILDKPIRDDKGRVIDIRRQVYRYQKRYPNKTTIYAKLMFADSISKINETMDFATMTMNVFGLIPNAEIWLNGYSVDINTTKILENEYFELRVVDDNRLIPSYIFTKGVPFAPLAKYLKDKKITYTEHGTLDVFKPYVINGLSKNCIINIKHGAFTPVQTRTRINMPSENIRLLETFIYDSLYAVTLYMLSRDNYPENPGIAFRNYLSKSMVDQVLPPYYLPNKNNYLYHSLDNFMTYFVYSQDGVKLPSFTRILNAIEVLIPDGQTYVQNQTVLRKNIEELINADKQVSKISEKLRSSLLFVVDSWFAIKAARLSPTQETTDGKPTLVVKKVIDTEKSRILQVLVTEFWRIVMASRVEGFKSATPTVTVKTITAQAIGLYDMTKNTIELSLDFVSKNWDEFNEALRTKNIIKLSRTELFRNLIGTASPACTLPHEIEHARRSTSHDSKHESAMLRLPGETKSTYYTFDECANAVWTFAIQRGLFDAWLRNI
jgi:hypothetical protein